MSWVGYIHINSVIFFQELDRAEVTLCGPRVARLLRAEAPPVGFHQSQRLGMCCSPHKHSVIKCGRT